VRLVPKTLLWRTFLLVAAVILVAVAAWFQIFRAYEREPRARNLAQMVASVVNITRSAIVTARPELRRALLLDLTELEGIRVYPSDDDEVIEPADESRAGARLLHEEIRRRLGDETRIAWSRNGEDGFFVSFRIDDDEYWVMMPRERFERRIALHWLGWGALALTLALAAAYIIVFRLKRPLRQLTAAARAIGAGRAPAPLAEEGPEEIETLARAFNQMSRDLDRLEADRALILAGVSHDLRTPLARLRLGIEMSEGDESLRQGMAADIDEMDRIIGQFLDFARAGAEDTTDAVDVADIARDLVRHYAEVGAPVADDIAATGSRPLRRLALRRAIANLVDNAHRYAGPDVALHVRAEQRAAVIEVLDRGPGIPVTEAERMKQPFTRLESARSNVGGSGLGLAIVDRIVQMHAGRFELLPRDGGGLVARITLPG
jgi:two-component system osmolarity sensor histidine kinase EnvZ